MRRRFCTLAIDVTKSLQLLGVQGGFGRSSSKTIWRGPSLNEACCVSWMRVKSNILAESTDRPSQHIATASLYGSSTQPHQFDLFLRGYAPK